MADRLFLRVTALVGLLLIGVLVDTVMPLLSEDAVGMLVGLVFGVMAGIPTALILLSAALRRAKMDTADDPPPRVKYTIVRRPGRGDLRQITAKHGRYLQ